jgi:hypothetical protein
MPKTSYLILFLCPFLACNSPNSISAQASQPASTSIIQEVEIDTSRGPIIKNLAEKRANNQAICIQVLVPLCDNDNQGIVQVGRALGDGQNLNTNLYWGAGYGIRTFFKKSANWQLVLQIPKPKEGVLERLVFKRNNSKQDIYFIADAYAGDRMKLCLDDYLASLAGTLTDSVALNDSTFLPINSDVDLLAFNGHNGLMDTYVDTVYNITGESKDAVAIACASAEYFKPYLKKSGGYPLIFTTNLMAPEAYVLDGVINAWLANKTPEQIRLEAGKAYHKYQKCGLRGATNLFTTRW